MSRAPMRLVPLPFSAFACCLAEALTTVPHKARPHGEITISIFPFFQRPSRLVLAVAATGAVKARIVTEAVNNRLIALT